MVDGPNLDVLLAELVARRGQPSEVLTEWCDRYPHRRETISAFVNDWLEEQRRASISREEWAAEFAERMPPVIVLPSADSDFMVWVSDKLRGGVEGAKIIDTNSFRVRMRLADDTDISFPSDVLPAPNRTYMVDYTTEEGSVVRCEYSCRGRLYWHLVIPPDGSRVLMVNKVSEVHDVDQRDEAMEEELRMTKLIGERNYKTIPKELSLLKSKFSRYAYQEVFLQSQGIPVHDDAGRVIGAVDIENGPRTRIVDTKRAKIVAGVGQSGLIAGAMALAAASSGTGSSVFNVRLPREEPWLNMPLDALGPPMPKRRDTKSYPASPEKVRKRKMQTQARKVTRKNRK